MGRPKKHEDRKTYRREWQRAKQRKEGQEERYKRFKALLDDVLEYEKQGLTYSEIAQELTNDYKYILAINKEIKK